MGQQEVFAFLERNRNKWFTTRQIAERLKASLAISFEVDAFNTSSCACAHKKSPEK